MSCTPRSASSRAMPRLTDDLGNCSSRAATEKLPVRATASKIGRRFRSIRRSPGATVNCWRRCCADGGTCASSPWSNTRDGAAEETDMARNRWEIDVGHSAIHFWVRHLVISKVHGRFARWSGSIDLDDADFTRSTVAVRIDAASIDTQVADRDNHLRSPDFLDVERHPELAFTSKRIEKAGEGYRVVGDLQLHGVG